ncbi:MAG TPA: carboxypeptidase regulatory-like domain-containing protein [Candidatus Sulfotelmatobacter sp.]|nr:carboxypeptidase regulatory-like domain-containing protein [Candidatus Sulfotelmatobacter sp.]
MSFSGAAGKADRGAACAPTQRGIAPVDGQWRHLPRRLGCFALLSVVAMQAFAQSAPAKFRVSGKVVNVVNGHPLGGAEVWFGKAEDFEETQQKLLTGDDGVFVFTATDRGKYLLNAQANGFRRQGFEQHGIYSSATVVGAGLNTENIVFRLRPDGRVTGVVEDDDHEPVGGATIYLFRRDASFGLSQTSLVTQTVSDDRGHYRFAHLEPGYYYVAVSASPWFSRVLQQAEAAGNSALSQKPEFDIAYPITFYPGVTDVAAASQIALNEGEDVTADFTLSPVPALRVRVDQALADQGRPMNVALQQKIFDTKIDQTSLRQVPVEDAIEIRGVAPGRYALQLVSVGESSVRAQRSTLLTLTDDAEVDPENAPPATPIRGVVRMQAGQKMTEQAYVRLWNSRAGEVMDSTISDKGEISFASDFLTPGTYSVYAMNGPNSILSSLKATGAQVAGQTVQIAGGKPVELEIEMATVLSKITGTARRDKKTVAGAMILLVPEDAENNLPKFRRDESDSDGTFTLVDVLPGRYRVLAIEDGWDLEWANLSLLKKRLEHGQKIEVGPSKSYQAMVEVE